jgi:hypothetical protein
MPYLRPAAGELVAGTFRHRLTLSSGRFAGESGGIEWSFGRKHGLEMRLATFGARGRPTAVS